MMNQLSVQVCTPEEEQEAHPQQRWMQLSRQLLQEHRKWLRMQRQWRDQLAQVSQTERFHALETYHREVKQQQERYNALQAELKEALGQHTSAKPRPTHLHLVL